MVPKQVGLFVEINSIGEALLDKKRFANPLEQSCARPARQLAGSQLLRDGLDALERRRDTPLVPGQGDADRHCLGYQQAIRVGTWSSRTPELLS